MNKLFYKIHQSIQTHKIIYGCITFVIFSGLIWTALHIKFNEDISKLIPKTSENDRLQKVLNAAEFADKIIVNIQKQPEGNLEDLIQYATQFTDSLHLNSQHYIKDIQGKVEDETIIKTMGFVYDNLPLFLTPDDYNLLHNKTHKDSIQKLTENNYKTLISPSGIIAKETIVKDPLGISLLGLKNLRQLGYDEGFELKDGYLVSKNEENLLLFIAPRFKTSETSENEAFTKQLYQFQNELNKEFIHKVKSEYFGGILIADANAKQIKKDIRYTVTIALIVLMALFIFFYRKISVSLILFVPTLFGGILSISFLFLIRTEISAISLGIGAVLLGVTLDYSLHILTHIRNNDTVKELYDHVTKPILMSSITTALAFLCLLFIDSQALQDLGIFAAVSVLGASVFALIFIPQVYKGSPDNEGSKITFIDKIASFEFNKSKIFIGIIAIVTIISVFTYNRVGFNENISSLNYEPEELKAAEMRLDKITNAASKSLYIIAFGNNMENVLASNDSVYRVLEILHKKGTIINFNSVGALVTSKKSQEQKIKRWNNFWHSEKISQIKNDLISSGQAFGFKPTTFQQFYALLNKRFIPLEAEDFNTINTAVVEDFIDSNDGFHTIMSMIKIEDENIKTIKDLFSNNDEILVIDRQAINETLLGDLKNDFNKLIWYCFVIVLILLFFFYRNLKLVLVTVIPIVITWFITIGIMGLFQIEFNVLNVVISTFIFGLGVDYSIFITNGLRENKTGIKILNIHKTSVLLSVITTILGIGVLIFAKHPALYSISIVSVIGIISAMLIAFTIQPLLFNYLVKGTKKE